MSAVGNSSDITTLNRIHSGKDDMKGAVLLYGTGNCIRCLMPKLCVDHNKLENSERDGNTRASDLPLEKPVYRSGSSS